MWRKAMRVRCGDGPTAARLRRMLQALGFEVVFFMPVQGRWRHNTADVQPWQAQCVHEGRTVTIGSWETMTQCVRHKGGLVVARDEDVQYLVALKS